MSDHIMKAYLHVKNMTMLELALYKHQNLQNLKLQKQNLNSL